jgi:curved DNA-binding protein CbpA
MSEFTAKDYRRKFLEEIGFPLIRANAERFVPGVGDLRKPQNLKLVYEKAMEWKQEQVPRDCTQEQERITQLEFELEQLRASIEESKTLETETPTPEEHLVEYISSVPEECAEKVIATVLSLEDLVEKETYLKLAKALHPDTSRLPKNKAEALIKIANRLHEIYSSNTYIVYGHGIRQSEAKAGTSSWLVDDDIDF